MRISVLIFIFSFLSFNSFAQRGPLKQTDIKHFMFVATSMAPSKEGFKLLNTPYDVTIKGDTLISFLPYSGNASYSTPGDQNLRFTSYNTSSSSKQLRKGTQLEITVTDQNNTAKYLFFISNNGTATLDVTSNFRDPISYRGYVKSL